MIDEKGRLFGKINIIDLIIILVLVLGAVFAVIRFTSSPEPEAEVSEEPEQVEEEVHENVPAEMKFLVSSTYDFAAEKLEKGMSVWDSTDDAELGTIASFTVTDDADNEALCSVEIMIDCRGYSSPHGVVIDETLFGIGHTMVIYCDNVKLYGVVESAEVK